MLVDVHGQHDPQRSQDDPPGEPAGSGGAEADAGGHARAPAHLRQQVIHWAARHAVLLPLVLVSLQVLANFLFLRLPTGLVAGHPGQSSLYHHFLASRGAYSDLYTMFWQHRLYLHPVPYLDIRIQYPVLLGLFMTGAAAVTHGVISYFLLSALCLWASAIACVLLLWSTSRRAALLFAASPMLLVFSLLNWDLFAIALMLAGWRASTRDRPIAAAIWLTLATFAKLYPGVLLLFCGIELVRRWRSGQYPGRRVRSYWLAALGTALVVNLPFALLDFARWKYFFVFNDARNTHVSILYFTHLLTPHTSLEVANLATALVIAVAFGLGLVALWRGRAPEGVAASVFVVVLLAQKVWSPQYALWFLVFALLASWDVWTVALANMLGLANYASAAVMNYLQISSDRLATWYAGNVEPFERDVRLIVLLVVLAASSVAVRRRIHAVAGLVPAREQA